MPTHTPRHLPGVLPGALSTVTFLLAMATPACECDTISPEGHNPSASATTMATADPTGATDTPTGGQTSALTGESTDGSTGTSLDTSGKPTATSEPTTETDPDIPTLCGNGVVDPGEECDNGPTNLNNLDCTQKCTLNVCGDGFQWQGMEECDDGGESELCDVDCTLAMCKDGVVNLAAGESCDDANDTPLDGCEIDCKRTKLTGIFTGGERTCVLIEGTHLKCWGNNSRGQLGYGHINTIGDDEPASAAGFVDVGGPVAKVSMGLQHICAILENGDVRCWGYGKEGRLGTGNTGGTTCLDQQQSYKCAMHPACCIGDDELPSTIIPLPLGEKSIEIAAGGTHTCALSEGGSVRCWGSGAFGQLGLGSTNILGDDEAPGPQTPLNGSATHIYAGWLHSCATMDGGGLRCWGDGGLGLADGICETLGDNELPVAKPFVKVGGNITTMSLGDSLTCALMNGGAVKCWGYAGLLGSENSLGAGCEMGDMPPPNVLGLENVVELSTGHQHTCVRLSDDTVRCWGFGTGGKLGYGNQETIGDEVGEMPPDPLPLGGTPVMISAGDSHTCVIIEGERLKCWGHNFQGQLGYGHTNNLGDEPGEMPPPDVPLFP